MNSVFFEKNHQILLFLFGGTEGKKEFHRKKFKKFISINAFQQKSVNYAELSRMEMNIVIQ